MPLQQGRCDGCKKTFLRAGLGKVWGSWLEIDQGVNESESDAFNRTQAELARQIMHPDGPETRD